MDDTLYMRNDHKEGLWINPTFCVKGKNIVKKYLTRKRKRPT
jgi:hypothetical protein